ncbi:hypothetical protein GCM10010284_07850 [Streptomyces rubiginosohelvolus]|uniref:Uncharacterized protein n=1 Tax=Streptomyces rubiginosohelvolus TaxID=67362 RepID=A0ABQ3BFJ3_9ACTN|nr:hypothetical protein GCM10010284_07850 [Streptomyces rubiginosohelvolus]GGZ41043.1 hypothetical protein GCM10010328_14330 [Streptomyces pluricolorescens]
MPGPGIPYGYPLDPLPGAEPAGVPTDALRRRNPVIRFDRKPPCGYNRRSARLPHRGTGLRCRQPGERRRPDGNRPTPTRTNLPSGPPCPASAGRSARPAVLR